MAFREECMIGACLHIISNIYQYDEIDQTTNDKEFEFTELKDP